MNRHYNHLIAGILLALPAAFVTPAHAGWTPLGPAPITVSPISSWMNVEGMAQWGNPSVGAMNVVLEAPGLPGTFYVGTANGGVWKSANAGQSWVALTDRLSSLSIGDMTFDRNDPSKLYIGFGKQSNYDSNGGPLNSIKLSTDGGATWSSPDTGNVLIGKDIVRLAVDGALILAGIKNPGTGETGLYRSVSGGSGLALVGTGSGLAAGKISDLRLDPFNSQIVYASVTNGTPTAGVYRSADGGATWNRINGITTADKYSERILLATQGATVVAGVINGSGPLQTSFYRSDDSGATWRSLHQPVTSDRDGSNSHTGQGLFPGGQYQNAALYIDPKNPNIIYVSGDRQPDNGSFDNGPNSIGAKMYSGRLFRGVFDPAAGTTAWEPLTHIGATGNSAPHADSRSIFIDSGGRLIETDDGGIYARSNPQGTGDWTPLHGAIQVSEVDASSWNPLANIAIAGMQDNGSAYQIKGTNQWGLTAGGDGGANAVNWQTFGSSGTAVIYGSSQYMGSLVRFTMFADGSVDAASKTNLSLALDPDKPETIINGNGGLMPFYPALALNRFEQTRFAVGGYALYIGQDDPQRTSSSNEGITLKVSALVPASRITGVSNDGFGSIAYGVFDRPNAILAGIGDQDYGAQTPAQAAENNRYGQLWYSDDVTLRTPVQLTRFDTVNNGKPGQSIQSLVFDGKTGSSNFYVADGVSIWRATRTGDPATLYDFNAISAGLPANFIARRATEYVSHNGVNALLAGGLHNTTTDEYVNPIYYTIDPAKNNGVVWTPLGKLLPNAPVFALHYSSIDDVLLVSTLGRGLFAQFDFTTMFPQAVSLTFGQADNDSQPAAEQLSDGFADGTSFSRPLIKVGSGILNLTGAAPTYSGATQLKAGVVLAANESNLGRGSLVFAGGSLQLTSSDLLSRDVVILQGGGWITTDSATRLSLTGSIGGLATLYYDRQLDIAKAASFTPLATESRALGSGFTLLQADGGITGSISRLIQPAGLPAGTRYAPYYQPQRLSFLLTPVSYADLVTFGIALSAPQRSIGRALDALRPADSVIPAGEVKILFNALYLQDAPAISASIDSLGGSIYASALQASLSAAGSAMNTITERLNSRAAGQDAAGRFSLHTVRTSERVGSVALRDDPAGIAETRQAEGFMVWGDGSWRSEKVTSQAGAPGYTLTTGSGTSGIDYRFKSGVTAGFGFGYAGSTLRGANGSGTATADTWRLFGYAGYGRPEGAWLNLIAGGGFDQYRISRTVQVGAYQAPLQTTPGGNSVFSSADVGYRRRLGSFSIDPGIGLQYAHIRRDRAVEQGSLAALNLDATELDSLQLSLGMNGSYSGWSVAGMLLTPACRAAYLRELLDRNATGAGSMAGQPVIIAAPAVGRDTVRFGGGIAAQLTGQLQLSIDFDGMLRDRYQGWEARGGLRAIW